MVKQRFISKKYVLLILGGYIIILFLVWNGINQYLIQQNPQLAQIQEYKEAVKRNPNYAGHRNELGSEYLKFYQQTLHKSYLKKAKQQFKQAVDLEPNNIEFRYNFAITLGLMKDEAAIKQYKKILKIDPLDVRSNLDLAVHYSTKKNYDKAIFHFQKCLELEPTAANIYFELAKLYEKQDDNQQALQMYELTKKYDPNYEGIDQKLDGFASQNGD